MDAEARRRRGWQLIVLRDPAATALGPWPPRSRQWAEIIDDDLEEAAFE